MKQTHHLPLSIAPMVNWTNTHFRRLMRLIAPNALVYTEMEAVQAVLLGKKKSVYFDDIEHPIALQLGGSDISLLADAVKMAQKKGFDEVNLNMGCPSPKVQKGRFGACLMKEGEHVSRCIDAMKQVAQVPITIKMRIGVDEHDSLDFFLGLSTKLIESGADKLVIHARKAWLKGLSPKENRTIPPLNYDYVYELKRHFPQTPIMLNGELNSVELIQAHQKNLDGVMIGRLACRDPFAIGLVHRYFYPETPLLGRATVLNSYLDYAYKQVLLGEPFSVVCKPLLTIAHGQQDAKHWKQCLMKIIHEKSPEALFQLSVSEESFTDSNTH